MISSRNPVFNLQHEKKYKMQRYEVIKVCKPKSVKMLLLAFKPIFVII